MVINNTMSNDRRLPSDALGALSKKRQDNVRFAFFFIIIETPSDQVGAEPTEASKILPLAPSGSETLSNATSQL